MGSRKLKPVRCCYCGKEFTPVVTNDCNDPKDLFERIVGTMQWMLDDPDFPLECGDCIEHPPVSDNPVM